MLSIMTQMHTGQAREIPARKGEEPSVIGEQEARQLQEEDDGRDALGPDRGEFSMSC